MIETPAALLNARATGAMDRWKLVFLFMAATSLGYFVVQLDVSIVNLSLPAIQDYRLNVSELQWIVNAYTLSFSIILLSAGVLGDRYGNKNFPDPRIRDICSGIT
jgi:DHA2 family methylenomycin A resistance protein-like MFS transporter